MKRSITGREAATVSLLPSGEKVPEGRMRGGKFHYLSLFFLILLAGCSSKPSKFYLLMPHNGVYSSHQSPAIGLGPITLPSYLDRPQIVTRLSNQEIKINEFDRWGESLKENIQYVLKENLEQLIPTSNVNLYPWTLDMHIDYRISIDITQFDTDFQGRSVLSYHWKITDKLGHKVYAIQTSRLTRQANFQDFQSIVSNMNQNLTTLSLSISNQIKRLNKIKNESEKNIG